MEILCSNSDEFVKNGLAGKKSGTSADGKDVCPIRGSDIGYDQDFSVRAYGSMHQGSVGFRIADKFFAALAVIDGISIHIFEVCIGGIPVLGSTDGADF